VVIVGKSGHYGSIRVISKVTSYPVEVVSEQHFYDNVGGGGDTQWNGFGGPASVVTEDDMRPATDDMLWARDESELYHCAQDARRAGFTATAERLSDLRSRKLAAREAQRVRGVHAGDVIRLAAPWGWAGLKQFTEGVIGGVLGGPLEGGSITFNAATYRDDQLVSCSGGPGTIHTEAVTLRPTGEMRTVRVWRFKDDVPRAHNGEGYTVTVPVWTWTPQDYQRTR